MGVMRFNYRSQAVGGYVNVTIVYPTDYLSYYDVTGGMRGHDRAGGERYTYAPGMKFQTVYLMHGGGDDDSLTYRYTNAELYAQRNHVMLVTPSIVNSFGVNTAYGVDYSTFLTEELPVVVRSLFASSSEREDNFIMGYAMGGNVALGSALMRPELFSVCVDISGGIGLTVNTENWQEELKGKEFDTFNLYRTTFGYPNKLAGSGFDIRAAAQRNIDKNVKLPKFYLIAGSEEGQIGERVRTDAETLEKMGYDVIYTCVKGQRHNFDFWDSYIKIALDELLPLRREPIYQDKC